MNWSLLHARVHQTLRSRQLLRRNQRLLVAVSGGQDSLCLLQMMQDLQPRWQWQLGVIHCDHQWRSDSAANAQFVKEWVEAQHIPFYLRVYSGSPQRSEPSNLPLANLPRANPFSIHSEAAARQWRYQQFLQVANQYEFDVVLTGHTASDRAETLLYNLMRGCGSDGLGALQWKRSWMPEEVMPKEVIPEEGTQGAVSKVISHETIVSHPFSPNTDSINQNSIVSKAIVNPIVIVRPLLEIQRHETAEFCQTFNLPIWEDSTNHDRQYQRNRIRLDLLPYLQEYFNPQVALHLSRTAELIQADVDYLEQEAQTQRSHLQANHKLHRLSLQQLSLSIQRRVIRQFLQEQLPEQPTYDHIEKMVGLIQAPQRTQTDPFPGGTIAWVEGEWIILDRKHTS